MKRNAIESDQRPRSIVLRIKEIRKLLGLVLGVIQNTSAASAKILRFICTAGFVTVFVFASQAKGQDSNEAKPSPSSAAQG
jgi:hypothetical protein